MVHILTLIAVIFALGLALMAIIIGIAHSGQEGTPGPTGGAGPMGPNGIPGGALGPTGFPGPTGIAGMSGQGITGIQGAAGPAGPIGPTGPANDTLNWTWAQMSPNVVSGQFQTVPKGGPIPFGRIYPSTLPGPGSIVVWQGTYTNAATLNNSTVPNTINISVPGVYLFEWWFQCQVSGSGSGIQINLYENAGRSIQGSSQRQNLNFPSGGTRMLIQGSAVIAVATTPLGFYFQNDSTSSFQLISFNSNVTSTIGVMQLSSIS